MKLTLKNILITLIVVAVMLGIVAFYVVFYSGGGTYVVSSPTNGPDAAIFATGTEIGTAGLTPSSSLALASSSASSSSASASSTGTGAPAVTWTQDNETMSATGAKLSGTQLTLNIQVQMGAVAECVPMNLRLIADEQGDLSPPITSQFSFPDTGTCSGTPGELYSGQQVVFTVSDPTAFPFILTTGGTANMLFEVTQNPDGTLGVQLPPQAD